MQTNIAYSLKGQNTRLLAELWNRRKSKTANELALVLRYELSKTVCGMIWDVQLLKTSILVTRTPWTTINSLSHKYIRSKHTGHVSARDAKERMSGAVKDVKEFVLQALKRFAEYR